MKQRDSRGRWVQPTFEERLAVALAACTRTPEGCLVWAGAVAGSGGYPVIRGANGKMERVSRLVLAYSGAEPPSGKHLACHTCDNPRCVERSHLFWGTARENAKDSYSKGRGYWGSSKHRANVGEAASKLMANDLVYREAVLLRLRHCGEKKHG